MFSRFSIKQRLVTDGRTDGQTEGVMASTAHA